MARKITFLRHGNAAAPYENAPDKMRILSDKGRKQAQKRHEQMGNPKFDLIICSQVIRTAETALEVAGEGNVMAVVMLYELFTPYSGPIHDALHRLFDKLAHKPLSAYYAENPVDVEWMKEFGATGWDAITEKVRSFGAENVLVVGHGMYSTCMVHAASPEKSAVLMDLAQGECDGFVVLFDENDMIANVTPLPKLE